MMSGREEEEQLIVVRKAETRGLSGKGKRTFTFSQTSHGRRGTDLQQLKRANPGKFRFAAQDLSPFEDCTELR